MIVSVVSCRLSTVAHFNVLRTQNIAKSRDCNGVQDIEEIFIEDIEFLVIRNI